MGELKRCLSCGDYCFSRRCEECRRIRAYQVIEALAIGAAVAVTLALLLG
jgi:hypothetical protein